MSPHVFFFECYFLPHKPLKNKTPNPSVSKIHFNLAEIVFHNIVYNISLSSSLHPHWGSYLETELYNHVHVNCSTSRHKTTAVVGMGGLRGESWVG